MGKQDISITHLPGINYLIIKKVHPAGRFFWSNDSAVAIPIDKLAYLIYFLVMNNYMSPKVLEGVLEDYHSNRS